MIKTAPAILTRKRAHPNRNGRYIVDLECSQCGHSRTVTFSGWSAIGCPGCGAELQRTPCRKPA